MLAYNLLLLVQLRDSGYLWLCCFIAGIFIAAWLPMLVAMAVLMAMNYGLLPAMQSVWVLPYVSVLLILLLLSVAQADRINALRRQAERAQAALERNEAGLTELVDARTRDLAQARDRAEAASRTKTRFLANMSHDLRTPLNAILGGVDLLRRSSRLGADERGQCGLIQRGGHHLLRLIEDLLDNAVKYTPPSPNGLDRRSPIPKANRYRPSPTGDCPEKKNLRSDAEGRSLLVETTTRPPTGLRCVLSRSKRSARWRSWICF